MGGMRAYTDKELSQLRRHFTGRYQSRDRCYFELALQTGLRVSELLSLTVGQVCHEGVIVEEVNIPRKHLKNGKRGKASGRTVPLFPTTRPWVEAWLKDLCGLMYVAEIAELDPTLPLFLSRVSADGAPRALSREYVFRLTQRLAQAAGLQGRVGTHSARKTLARQAYAWSKDVRLVQQILGHRSLASTEHYLESLNEGELWAAFQHRSPRR